MQKKYSITACLLLSMASLFAKQKTALRLANVLQSNMVLQQNKPFTVWGSGLPGASVIIKADFAEGETSVLVNRDSSFFAIISIPPVGENDFTKHELSIESNGEKIVLQNLLIGELWFCSGQSNMQYSMKGIKDSAIENADTDYPGIRLFNAGLNFSATPIHTISGKWQECSGKTVLNFSAVGFNFGKELFKNLHVPVGLIFSGIGASTAQAFVPQEVLAADTMLDRVYLQPYLLSDKSKEIINGGFSFEKVTRPFLLYNAMINPFINLSIRGFCWYQGEANRNERGSYTHLTQELIKSWRSRFAQGDLPFYYVQIAPFFYDKEDPMLADCAFFREAQEKISTLNNTAMVVTMDVGEAKDLHPQNKKPIGIRLAKTALHETYNRLDVLYQGPQFDYASFNRNKVIVHFDAGTVVAGLQTNDGKSPAHFMVAGADRMFFPAEAVIDNNTVIVWSAKVKRPVAVRYAFTNYPVTNLENKNKFPVLPFRSDNWPEKNN